MSPEQVTILIVQVLARNGDPLTELQTKVIRDYINRYFGEVE